MACDYCHIRKANLIRPRTGQKLCKLCFTQILENEVLETIHKNNLFERGDKLAIAISGGKDSTVLAHILALLNVKYDLGLSLSLLSVDEGIANYREHSLSTVSENRKDLDLSLLTVSYEQEFRTTMDEIVRKVGRKSNCTYCGILRRQALEKGATQINATFLVTGHNADDMAETVLMNLLRGDVHRLKVCTAIKTQGKDCGIPRVKPFKYIYEKEIVMYAFYKDLRYFSAECNYSPGAYRGHARLFVKELERSDPGAILSIIKSGDTFRTDCSVKSVYKCIACGHPTGKSESTCKGCDILKKLSKIVLT